MAATALELPPDVQRELEALARRTGRTEAEVIVEAVERHLQAEQRLRSKAIGIYGDPEGRASTTRTGSRPTGDPKMTGGENDGTPTFLTRADVGSKV